MSSRLRDAPITHLFICGLICFFVLSPVLFTPWGFGPDFSNHLWLVWQQGHAISNTGHPTLFLQTPGGIFQPFYGFYGGTLYAAVGALSALLGNHAYPAFVASMGVAVAIAYGGMWWLGRQLGLTRWLAHLPAFVTVTAAYYLTDAYARGAWPELLALSAVPLFTAGAMRLLAGPWRAGPVALFLLATVIMTGSHNITLFWSVFVLGPVAVAIWIVLGQQAPTVRRVLAVLGVALLGMGINAWFLVLDVLHSTDVLAWPANKAFLEDGFADFFYFNNLGTVLNPLRQFPAQSTTYGLVIAPPMAAFGLSVVLTGLAWPQLRGARRALLGSWLVLLATMAALVVLMVMPASWWIALGAPFTNIQFPYRLAGWLLIAVAAQLAISLRFASELEGTRHRVATVLAAGLVVVTIAQAAAQLYAGPRLEGAVNYGIHPHEVAFENGPLEPPATFYDPYSYADASRPIVETPNPRRTLILPEPPAGGTEASTAVPALPGHGPIATNIAAGPYVGRVEGLRVIGRTPGGAAVLKPPAQGTPAQVRVVADGGVWQTLGGGITVTCLLASLGLVFALTMQGRLRYPRRR